MYSSTPGHDALHRLLRPAGTLTAYRIAKDLGLKPESVYRWVKRRGRPSAYAQKLISARYGIPEASWFRPDELSGIAAAERFGARVEVVRDEDVPEYDPAVDEPSPEEVAS
jgi:transcriptional regulator with XRE-family HTH domain